LEELSQIDGLTKIHNRRYFDEKIEEVWREYSRLKHPISIIMIDVDNFKKFNDYYGHQQGDVCLCAVASAIKDQLKRSSDSIARYGGEEFIVIACIDADDASILAEKMRLAVKLLAIEHKSSEGNIVTISLGVASTVPAQDKEINKLVKAADVALYTSKQKGKDMTTVKEYEI
jgi:diguanylate cyclase (GGDEF)-like protein